MTKPRTGFGNAPRTLLPAIAALVLVGCPSVRPPQSPFPDAKSLLSRMKETTACGHGLQGEANVDHFGERGRIRGKMLLFAVRPGNLRLDLLAPPPISGPVATLASDGKVFFLHDVRSNPQRFLKGKASPCNIARLTTIPMPTHVLVDLWQGRAPLLRHDEAGSSIRWDGKGYYEVTLKSTREAIQTIRLVPHPDDFSKPWQSQRVRVLGVSVRQQGFELYEAAFDEHQSAPMAKPILPDLPDEPTIPVSGPECTAEVPRKIHVRVPNKDDDLRFRYEQLRWNPPLRDDTFTLRAPATVPTEIVHCE